RLDVGAESSCDAGTGGAASFRCDAARSSASCRRMSLNLRTYHELAGADRSGLPEQIAAQRRRVTERLAGVCRLIAVMSGKGGVGKGIVTVHLAGAVARAARDVGALADAV